MTTAGAASSCTSCIESSRKKSPFCFFLLLKRPRINAFRQWPWIKRAIKHQPPLHHSHSGSRFLATASESAARRTARSISRGDYKVTPGNLHRCPHKKKNMHQKKTKKPKNNNQEAARLRLKARGAARRRGGAGWQEANALAPFFRLTQLMVLWTRKTCSSLGCRQPFNNAWTREGGNQYQCALTCYITLHVRMFPRVVYIVQGLAPVPNAHLTPRVLGSSEN